MRNSQLIRQWKILKLFADMPSEKFDVRYEELADMFGTSTKTIKRDLAGLKDAGFIDTWMVRTQLWKGRALGGRRGEGGIEVVVREQEVGSGKGFRRRFKRKDVIYPVLDYIERRGGVDDPVKCNVCGYVFKVGISGGVDMKDFRWHKQGHLVVGGKDREKAESGKARGVRA